MDKFKQLLVIHIIYYIHVEYINMFYVIYLIPIFIILCENR